MITPVQKGLPNRIMFVIGYYPQNVLLNNQLKAFDRIQLLLLDL